MTVHDGLGNIADSDQLDDGYFNDTQNILLSNVIINSMNAGVTFPQNKIYIDLLTSDSADTKTNWTYDSGDDNYQNQQTSQAILEFENLLTKQQKADLNGEQSVVLWIDDTFVGDVDTSLVGNYSFETAGGGGADVFASWTESIDANMTLTRDSATQVTIAAATAGVTTVSSLLPFSSCQTLISSANCSTPSLAPRSAPP